MPNTSRSRRSVISPSTWTLATALLWITSQAAMADRPYRILKVDDLPDASASRSDGQLLGQWGGGTSNLTPGTVLSWGGDCGQSVPIIPAALTAVNALGFEDLDQFASIGLMLGAEGFQPFMDLAADMTRTIVFEGAPQ